MSIVTLTSDWGYHDHYMGSVKGTLSRLIPGVNIIDITHKIALHDIIHASFVLKSGYRSFPADTIHIIGVDADATLEQPHTVIRLDNHYFIGADNGIFSLLSQQPPEKIIQLDIYQDNNYFTFPERDIFCKAAAEIANGTPLEKLGNEVYSVKQLQVFKPVITQNRIKAKVIHIDAYHNLITNLDYETFQKVRQGRKFQIHFYNGQFAVESLSDGYSDVSEASILAVFDSEGYLEIALNKGKASELLGMELDSPVIIDFMD